MSRRAAALRRILEAEPWRPGRARLLARSARHARLASPEVVDSGSAPVTGRERRLQSAADWLAACHDASADGGLPGRYALKGGWTASYPETTGYAVPTLLTLSDALGESGFRERAGRCVEFLLGLQSADGSFAGGEVGSGAPPSVFNTAQILGGLDAWEAATGDATAGRAAERAAAWLASVQDEDGAWRRHTYGGVACAYYAHASCWLARFAARGGMPESRRAAERHVEWVLGCQEPSGWFAASGFPDRHSNGSAHTHTIGYTLWGLLLSADALGRSDAAEAVGRAASALAARVVRLRAVPGIFDREWHPRARYACLTGSAQLAQVWLRLDREGAGEMARAGRLALAGVAAAQDPEAAERGIRGGVPGSWPLWGDYLPNAFPNWAAKFFIDALLEERGPPPATSGPRGGGAP